MTSKQSEPISEAPETAVAKPDNAATLFNDDALANVTSLDDALRMLGDSNAVVESIADYGSGFSLCEDKSALVGTPFVIMEWRFNTGDYADKFVSATVVTEDGRKLIINDGGSGIRQQLEQVTGKRIANASATPQAGLICRKGLTKSEYKYLNEKGEWKPAVTFYLAQ